MRDREPAPPIKILVAEDNPSVREFIARAMDHITISGTAILGETISGTAILSEEEKAANDARESRNDATEVSFEKLRFRTAGACDGQQALGMLAREKFDILITDIVMPNVDGIALALKATKLYPDLRVIMISGYAQERVRAHNLETLAHQIIPKPFAIEDLAKAIEDALRTKG